MTLQRILNFFLILEVELRRLSVVPNLGEIIIGVSHFTISATRLYRFFPNPVLVNSEPYYWTPRRTFKSFSPITSTIQVLNFDTP